MSTWCRHSLIQSGRITYVDSGVEDYVHGVLAAGTRLLFNCLLAVYVNIVWKESLIIYTAQFGRITILYLWSHFQHHLCVSNVSVSPGKKHSNV